MDRYTYTWKQKGDAVVELQRGLMRRGFGLPKWGADGDLGGETWGAVEKFADVDQYPAQYSLPRSVTDAILAPADADDADLPAGHVRVVGDPADVKGWRSWQDIDAIVLHQTGIKMTDTPERFRTLDAHVGILIAHPTPIVQVQDLLAYMYHANELNRPSIGIELNGYFPGVEARYDTAKHTGAGPTVSQVMDARRSIAWLCETAHNNGGAIRRILPHRVSNDTRQGDPGEGAWREIGLWAIEEYGLTDGGAGYCVGDGTPIPFTWCPKPAYEGIRY
jgi:hypothetical protein